VTQPVLTPQDLAGARWQPAVAWASRSVRDRVAALGSVDVVDEGVLPAGTRTLVAVGGGGLIDRAKSAAAVNAGAPQVVAVPSVWGSGAEASPVIVLDAPDGTKDIRVDDAFVPAARVAWPELAETVAPERRRLGSADAWAHVLEAFTSPLGDAAVRADAAALLAELTAADPEGPAADWLERSARACAIQARAGVGLAHGIAHVLEGPLRAAQPDAGWHHARIVAAVLGPVFAATRAEAPKWAEHADAHGLDGDAIAARLAELPVAGDLERLAPALREHWKGVLRDPLTRINGFLVRRGHLDTLIGAPA
jgi:alcohol dehydrogenase class IV